MGAATFTPAASTVAVGHVPTGYNNVGTDGKGFRFIEGTLVLSSSYATGGDTLALPSGLSQVVGLEIIGNSQNTSGLSYELATPGTAPKVKAYDTNATEVTAATALNTRSAVRVRLLGYS